MNEVSRLQKLVKDERSARLELSVQATEQLDTIRQLQHCESELRQQQERVQRIREERERMCEEARQLRDENYSLMHDLTRLSEEKNCVHMRNRDLQLEVMYTVFPVNTVTGTLGGIGRLQPRALINLIG